MLLLKTEEKPIRNNTLIVRRAGDPRTLCVIADGGIVENGGSLPYDRQYGKQLSLVQPHFNKSKRMLTGREGEGGTT